MNQAHSTLSQSSESQEVETQSFKLENARALAFSRALFPQMWLAKNPLPLGRRSSLVVASEPLSAESPSLNASQPAPQSKRLLFDQASKEQLNKEQPVKKQFNKEQPNKEQSSEELQAQYKPSLEKAVLAVEGPGQFHVAATMLDATFGVVIHLGDSQRGLGGADYLMVSKLVKAARQLIHVPSEAVDFAFFRWPPQKGLAKGLDPHEMGLSALKGFLHKMADKRQCSWLMLGPEFAQFCFQDAALKAFDQVPRATQQLLVAPSLAELHEDPGLKQKLWSQMKAVLNGTC